MVDAKANGVVQGGSSLTQQLAKNIFLSNERTITRKVKEAYLALWLEGHLTKRQILQLYLDRVYMGGGTFGIQAAAQFYFGKSVRDVTLAEAAMLAGLFKAPTKYAPHVNLPAARARANEVLNNLVDAGYLTRRPDLCGASAIRRRRCRAADDSPDWYIDWAYNEVRQLADAGKLGNNRVLTVRTALDPNLQKYADDDDRGPAARIRPELSCQTIGDGHPRPVERRGAYHRRRPGLWREPVQSRRGGLRQPGSSFKPFVYLTALLTGKFKPTTTVVDSPVCIGNWCPHNFGDKYMRRVCRSITALAHSLNTVAVKLSIAIGEAYSVKATTMSMKRPSAAAPRSSRRRGKWALTTPLPDTVSLPIGADGVNGHGHGRRLCDLRQWRQEDQSFAAVEITTATARSSIGHDRDAPPPKQVIDKADHRHGVDDAQCGAGWNSAGAPNWTTSTSPAKPARRTAIKDAWFNGYSGNYRRHDLVRQ